MIQLEVNEQLSFFFLLSYEVMKHCWCENPEDRPSFSQLRRRFDHFLGVYKQDHRSYIEITVSNLYLLNGLCMRILMEALFFNLIFAFSNIL